MRPQWRISAFARMSPRGWVRIHRGWVGLVVLLLPFEMFTPWIDTAWFRITNWEIAFYGLLIFTLGRVWMDRSFRLRSLWWRDCALRVTWAALVAWLGWAAVAAGWAPFHSWAAWKFAVRWILAAAFVPIVVGTVRTIRDLRYVCHALLLGAGISAVLGILEWFQWSPVTAVLAMFKAAPTHVGGFLRISATFPYATIAAMFFEAVLPVGLVLWATANSWQLRILYALGCSTLALAVVSTQTRTGVVTLWLVLAALTVWGWRDSHLRSLRRPAGWMIVLILLGVGMLTVAQRAHIRWFTVDDSEWYGAVYTVPGVIRGRTGDVVTVRIRVRNTGRMEWRPEAAHPVVLGMRWLTANGQAQIGAGHLEFELPHAVPPGGSVELQVPVRMEWPPGEYRIVWGMLQRNILWFRSRNVPEAISRVIVRPGRAPSTLPAQIGIHPLPSGRTAPEPVLRRITLWRTAVRMLETSPWLGVGPDNFRRMYGRYLGFQSWDQRIHANNTFLEILADIGVPGFLAWLVFVVCITGIGVRVALRAPAAMTRQWAAGTLAGWCAFLIHGILDYFLAFHATLLLWMLLAGFILVLHLNIRR